MTPPTAASAPPDEATPWTMSPFLRASVGLHVVAAGAALAAPPAWPWALGAVALNHAALSFTGLWPRSRWLGPNVVRLGPAAAARGEVALTIDDGPDPEVTPAVLDLLEAHGAVATFYCIAQRAERHAALTREIVARGHSVQNHSDAHDHRFSLSGPRGFATEIGRAQERLTVLTGVRPATFRAPAGLRNPFLDPVLHRMNLRLVSWTRRGFDTRDADAGRVHARLVNGLAAGDILLLHDGHCARGANGRPVVLDALPRLLDSIRHAGLHTVTLPHALDPIPPSATA
jgi:peptidoglycan/xylan/chitin deacetylase (PgdA/CDA1 family)